jgi:hypothetical protein
MWVLELRPVSHAAASSLPAAQIELKGEEERSIEIAED